MGKTGGNERNTKERWRNTRKKRGTEILDLKLYEKVNSMIRK